MAKKPLETAIAKHCTFLASIQSVTVAKTHLTDLNILIITFTDGLQVEYLCPAEGEHYLVVKEVETNTSCVVLYPECKPARLTFTILEEC